MLTERDIAILSAVVRYYILNRQQVQRLCFPHDSNGRLTRRRLQLLVDAQLLNRQSTLFCHPMAGAAAPVYFPSRKGCDLLAEHFDDELYLTTPTQAPIPHHTLHWLAVSETHIALDEAIRLQSGAAIEGWLNEWDVCNKEESAPEKRFRLYTLIRQSPRLICAPDAAFLLTFKGHRKIFYLEQDRNTSGVNQIASSKTPGYAAMAEQQTHRRHFPQATIDDFSVLMIAPTPRRRDALRKAIREKLGAKLWRFAAAADVQPDKVLYAPIWHGIESAPTPLIKGGP